MPRTDIRRGFHHYRRHDIWKVGFGHYLAEQRPEPGSGEIIFLELRIGLNAVLIEDGAHECRLDDRGSNIEGTNLVKAVCSGQRSERGWHMTASRDVLLEQMLTRLQRDLEVLGSEHDRQRRRQILCGVRAATYCLTGYPKMTLEEIETTLREELLLETVPTTARGTNDEH